MAAIAVTEVLYEGAGCGWKLAGKKDEDPSAGGDPSRDMLCLRAPAHVALASLM